LYASATCPACIVLGLITQIIFLRSTSHEAPHYAAVSVVLLHLNFYCKLCRIQVFGCRKNDAGIVFRKCETCNNTFILKISFSSLCMSPVITRKHLLWIQVTQCNTLKPACTLW
jgi:hypothetical protein